MAMMTTSSPSSTAALYGLVGITYLGAFSRLTHGRHTPVFYAYQIGRAPDDASTRLIPVADLVLATTMLAFPGTPRFAAAAAGAALQVVGIVARVRAGKNPTVDCLLVVVTGFVAYTSK